MYHVNVFLMSFRNEIIKHIFDGTVDKDVLINIIYAYSKSDYKIEIEMIKEGEEDAD